MTVWERIAAYSLDFFRSIDKVFIQVVVSRLSAACAHPQRLRKPASMLHCLALHRQIDEQFALKEERISVSKNDKIYSSKTDDLSARCVLNSLPHFLQQTEPSTLSHEQQHPGSDKGKVHDDGVVIVQLNGQTGMRVAKF